MDQIVKEKKIDSILRCLDRIKTRLPDTKEKFFQDLDAQDVIVLYLTRAMHICADSYKPIPHTT